MKKVFLFILPLSLFGQPSDDWRLIHGDPLFSISGVVQFKDGFLVVHDNKKKGQPRVSFIDDKFRITKLVWPEPESPFDLEAAIQIPGMKDRFIFMESSGKCYEVYVDPKDFRIDVLSIFTVPGLTPNMNLEGLTIFSSGQGFVFVYGDRGSNFRTSTLFTVFFNHKKKSFSEIETFTFNLPKPKFDRRNIADLALNVDGSLWCAATSDPGDSGPFSSVIYELGQFSHAGTFIPTHPKLLNPIMAFDGQKVEAMIFHNDGLLLMTDNENFGATIKIIKN